MKLCLFALAVAFLASATFAQWIDDAELDDGTKKEIEASPDGTGMFSARDQQEVRKDEETEGDDDDDQDYDGELCLNADERPTQPLPNYEEFQKLYANSEEVQQIKTKQAPMYDSRFTYWKPSSWYPVWKCCPRFFNYGCRSSSKRLGVFRHWWYWQHEWCYPVWPVYIRRCLCNECLVRNAWCPTKGKCNRRYTKRSFLAICNRGFGWSYFRYIRNKWLPSSCYCRANRFIEAATASTLKCNA